MKKPETWRLLTDLNISVKTISFLQSFGFDVKRISKDVSTDEELVKLAMQKGRVILTFDKNFGQIYYFHYNKKFTVIILYVKNQTPESVNPLLKKFLEENPFETMQNKLV